MRSGQRSHSRHAIALPVEIDHEGRLIRGTTRDISVGGMFILCPEAPRFGAKVQLRFDLEQLDRPVVAEATVRWVDPATGFGVQFAGLRALEVWALQKLLARRGDNAASSEGHDA